jgi:hypothetical protein
MYYQKGRKRRKHLRKVMVMRMNKNQPGNIIQVDAGQTMIIPDAGAHL